MSNADAKCYTKFDSHKENVKPIKFHVPCINLSAFEVILKKVYWSCQRKKNYDMIHLSVFTFLV